MQAYDMTLTISGRDYGYMLYEDENGQRHWNEGLAPLVTPQQRTNEFGYEHTPPEIDVVAAFEKWSDGAGFLEWEGSNAPTKYAYSQGVDASGERLYLSPARVADNASTGGAIAAAPSFFFYSRTFGFWCVASQYMYQYDLSSATWVLRNTLSAAGRSMAELNGVLYVSVTSAAYQYSTNGTTWTAFSDANLNSANIADLFVVRNNVLMAMRSEKAYVTTNGQNSGTAWSAGTSIGSSSETTRSLAVANGDYWIFKNEGIYNWDGTTVTDIWKPKYLTSTNGDNAFVWHDGRIYVTYTNSVLAIDPFDTQAASLAFVYPPNTAESTEIKGSISQITGDFKSLMFTITNTAGNTYLLKGNPTSGVWHTLAYLGANANSAAIVVSPGIAHSTNPVICTGYGTAAVHYILPRVNMRPEDDTACRFESTGTLYGPWISFGAMAFNKFLNSGSVLGTLLSAGQNCTLSYQLDDSTTTTQVVNAVDYGINEARVSGSVPFYRIRYGLTLTGASTSTTPVVEGATLHATLNPPRKRVWRPIVRLAPNQLLHNGSRDTQSVSTLRSALFSGAEDRITMTDRNGNSYTVRILDIQEQSLAYYERGGAQVDDQVLLVTLTEIAPNSSSMQAARYGQARYNQSYRFS